MELIRHTGRSDGSGLHSVPRHFAAICTCHPREGGDPRYSEAPLMQGGLAMVTRDLFVPCVGTVDPRFRGDR